MENLHDLYQKYNYIRNEVYKLGDNIIDLLQQAYDENLFEVFLYDNSEDERFFLMNMFIYRDLEKEFFQPQNNGRRFYGLIPNLYLEGRIDDLSNVMDIFLDKVFQKYGRYMQDEIMNLVKFSKEYKLDFETKIVDAFKKAKQEDYYKTHTTSFVPEEKVRLDAYWEFDINPSIVDLIIEYGKYDFLITKSFMEQNYEFFFELLREMRMFRYYELFMMNENAPFLIINLNSKADDIDGYLVILYKQNKMMEFNLLLDELEQIIPIYGLYMGNLHFYLLKFLSDIHSPRYEEVADLIKQTVDNSYALTRQARKYEMLPLRKINL